MRDPSSATYRTPSCIICGQVSLIQLPAGIAAAFSAGVPAQALLPNTSRAKREQLISGTHPACWAEAFSDPDRQ